MLFVSCTGSGFWTEPSQYGNWFRMDNNMKVLCARGVWKYRDGWVVYPANAFDTRLRGDKVPLRSSSRKSFRSIRPRTFT